jgi:hypothetical protein
VQLDLKAQPAQLVQPVKQAQLVLSAQPEILEILVIPVLMVQRGLADKPVQPVQPEIPETWV